MWKRFAAFMIGVPLCPVCNGQLHFKHGTWACREFCDPYEERD